MPTTQINARIDSTVKSKGDFGLAQAGYTPTQAIRALWGYAGKHAHDKKALAKLFSLIEDADAAEKTNEEADKRVQAVLEGALIFDTALAEMGARSTAIPPMSDEDLLEQAYLEKMEERGLLS